MPEEQEMQPRQVAFKVRIMDLIKGEYIEQEGWKPNYIVVGDKQVSRINIIAGVIDKQIGESLSTLTIDDGSGNIQVRAFKEDSFRLREIEIGDVVVVVGRPRKSANQYFISYEIVRKLDPLWAKVRMKELEVEPSNEINVKQESPLPPKENVPIENPTESVPIQNIQEEKQPFLEKNVVEEKKDEEKSSEDEYAERKKILELIGKGDDGNGAELENILLESGLDRTKAEEIIQELIKAGEIYENIAGRVKLL
jgi:hypothetical protein